MPIAHVAVSGLRAAGLVGHHDPGRAAAIAVSRRSSAASAGLDRPSERTMETLKRYDLERRYRKDVNNTLLSLEKIARNRPDAELVYALAELSWIDGEAARPLAQGPGDRPLPRRRRLRPRLPVRPRARRGPRAVRPAVPPGLRDLQRRPRAAHPHGPVEGPDRCPGGDQAQGPRPRAGAPGRAPRLSLDPRRHPQADPGLRLRGLGPGHQPQPVRAGRAPDRRPRDRPQEGRAARRTRSSIPTRWPSR